MVYCAIVGRGINKSPSHRIVSMHHQSTLTSRAAMHRTTESFLASRFFPLFRLEPSKTRSRQKPTYIIIEHSLITACILVFFLTHISKVHPMQRRILFMVKYLQNTVHICAPFIRHKDVINCIPGTALSVTLTNKSMTFKVNHYEGTSSVRQRRICIFFLL